MTLIANIVVSLSFNRDKTKIIIIPVKLASIYHRIEPYPYFPVTKKATGIFTIISNRLSSFAPGKNSIDGT